MPNSFMKTFYSFMVDGNSAVEKSITGGNMIETIDHLLEQYERGKLTRRDLLGGIALLLTLPLQKRFVQASVFKARSINHVNICVADVNRSEAFYRKVLGFP